MKRDILQIVVGTIVGTALVVGYLWSMLGGVFLILPIWVFVGMFVLFWASIVLVGLKAGYKGIVAVMVSFVLGWFGFDALHRHACGPDAEDVKVMKPMAQKISAYIVKHGIPERLEEIPDLPYRLEGCERKVEYQDSEKRVNSIKDAMYGNFSMNCMIFTKTKKYKFKLLFTYIYKNSNCIGSFEIFNPSSETFLNYSYHCKNKQIVLDEKYGKTLGSRRDDGICNPMRQ